MKNLSKNIVLILGLVLITACEKKESGLPVDGDGNEYDTVVIGNQIWLKENLRTTKYNNGISIPLTTDNSEWISKTSAAFCWYENNPSLKDNYGALYNWWAIKVSALCPLGYHVPSKEEWETLINYLGGESIAGAKLKAAGNQFWYSGGYATNESGFTALPGGGRSSHDGTFGGISSDGSWWSTSPWAYDNYAYLLGLNYNYENANLSVWFKKAGLSVRCIKDI
jgi:uncharacterized protein (TIGR02145 family)